jgi:tRNA-splicing ligase RtcB
LATQDVIIPNAVGVDIGCGVGAVKTSLTEIDTPTLKKIMGEIRQTIPVGFDHHKNKQDFRSMPLLNGAKDEEDAQDTLFCSYQIVSREFNDALKSLGTLGGGNHFIEIQKGSDGYIWIMIHSGSRNLGKQVADFYNDIAVRKNKLWHSSVPEEWELAFLPVDSNEGEAYLREMQYCVDFALANRKLMMERIKLIFAFQIDDVFGGQSGVEFDEIINIAHNYVAKEKHFGREVWVHRKGATLADKETIGIIPGSQGTKSYIVKGRGNIHSFKSCSHGAGRRMGRNQAVKDLNFQDEVDSLEKLGVLHSVRGPKDLDEAPGAYKPIDVVMRNQEDLVEILVELTPLAVIKG